MNNEIKSQDDLNTQGRETDVLIATLNKCHELVKKNVELENENKELRKKIHILTESQMNLENTVGELSDENTNLKRLLKECDKAFEKIQYNYGYDDSVIELSEPVQLKIKEVLK